RPQPRARSRRAPRRARQRPGHRPVGRARAGATQWRYHPHRRLRTRRRLDRDPLPSHGNSTTSFNSTLLGLRERLATVRHADRPRLARELDRLFARKTPDASAQKAADALGRAIEDSIARVARLASLPLKFNYDAALPIVAHREEIAKALQENQ